MEFEITGLRDGVIYLHWIGSPSDCLRAAVGSALDKRMTQPGPLVPMTPEGMAELESIVHGVITEAEGGG